MAFTLDSPAFHNGDWIPPKYARSGENVSPPLIWKDAPAKTRSFVLVVEDPDAPSGIFRHGAVYNIDGRHDRLPEGALSNGGGTDGLRQGVNDFGNPHYDGPQPPKGHGIHHYHFRLVALDTERLDLPQQANVEEVWRAARPHVLAEADLVGTFEAS